MDYKWLNKTQTDFKSRNLIVFFNGWAMNESVVEHFNQNKHKKNDFDILMVNDYRDVNFDFSVFNFKNYAQKYLVCWSMGVYAVNLFKEYFDDFDKKIAINGTKKIIDDNFGINKKIYDVTIKCFSESSCDKFLQNMFENRNLNSKIKIDKSIKDLKDELIAIQNFNLKNELNFTKAIISKKDRVVPTKNQINFWNLQKETEMEIIEAAHYPFENYNCWEELIGLF